MPPVPQHCPSPRELDDLELLLSGALVPTVTFNEPGSPVTLELPADVAAQAAVAGAVELVDPEGLPLAEIAVNGGTIDPLSHVQYGPFRRLYLTPAATRSQYAGRTFVPLVDALTEAQLAALATVGPVLLLPLVGHGTPDLSAVALIRATLAAATHLPDAAVVAVPLASHGDPDVDHELGVQVVANYAGADPVVGVTDDPTGRYPAEIAEIVEADRPARADQGLVLFFTGLSGSGKSTLARALMDQLLEDGTRTVTSLDGDVVRRNLSAGLTFSKEDRETNIRRIGWVAAEIARHGGVAVCSPIAPFDETRQQVRETVTAAGGAFFLVHVATPLEECERRDRKGLYAKARRGEIPEFTGISSPYEVPEDADVRVDTTGRTIEDALEDVIVALRAAGYLDLTDSADPLDRPAPPVVERAPAVEPAQPSVADVEALQQRLALLDPDLADPEPNAVVEEGAPAPVSKPPAPEPGGFETVAALPPQPPTEPEANPVVEEGAPAPVSNPPAPESGGFETVAAQAPQRPTEPEPAVEPVETPAYEPTYVEPTTDTRPIRVLFLCTANVCRSPFMELTATHLAGPGAGVTFSSAGTRGFPASQMTSDMAATLAVRGIPGAARFRSRAFTEEMIVHADLILTAETAHRQFVLDDHPAAFRKVFTLGQFAESVRALGPSLTGRDLLTVVAERRTTASPTLDIADPYQQGPEVAEDCATTIERLLRVVIPALVGSGRSGA